MKNIIRFILAVALPMSVGAVAGYFTSTSVKGWYSMVNKPSFNPPDWVFAPVWTLLYIMMGIAFYIIWNKETAAFLKRKAMLFYFAQLILNFTWSLVFFYAEEPGWALVNILLLWSLIAATIYWFSKISVTASRLLIPYILWVSFATLLNFAIWKLN
jgi:tryptophan-rich sensory protein